MRKTGEECQEKRLKKGRQAQKRKKRLFLKMVGNSKIHAGVCTARGVLHHLGVPQEYQGSPGYVRLPTPSLLATPPARERPRAPRPVGVRPLPAPT